MGYSRHKVEIRYGHGIVKYTLTFREQAQVVAANIKSKTHGGCPADHMSAELEDLLCGFVPSRHTLIEALSDNKINKLPDKYRKMLTHD